MRPGVAEVVKFCRTRDIRMRVLSTSLNAYVLPLLKPVGFENEEIICSQAQFAPSRIIAVGPPNKSGVDFKSAAVLNELAEGRCVVYVGDGSNDRAASHLATTVIARRRMLDYCCQRGVPHSPFEGFWDVLEWLEKRVR